MAKTNYSYEKRAREIEKEKKKEESVRKNKLKRVVKRRKKIHLRI